MAGNPDVFALLEEMLDSGRTAGRSVPRLPGVASRGPAAVAGFPPRRRVTRGVVSGPGDTLGCRRDRGRTPPRRPAAGSRLPGGGVARPRRHGRRLPGLAPAPEPPRRPEDAAGRPLRPAGGAGALPARGGGGRRPAPPQHRAGLRRWRRGRPAVLHDGVRRGRQPGRANPGGSSTGSPGGCPGGDAGRRHPRGAPERDRASRSQAGQHPAHRGRHAQGDRLRPGPAAGRRRRG